MELTLSGAPLDPAAWQIVNDSVMGGMSKSRVVAAPGGGVRFEGVVSLEYGGGFASARCAYSLPAAEARAPVGGFALRVHGDGKHYRLTIFTRSATTNSREPYHYQGKFETTGGEQEIRLPLAAFSASLRGRQVAAPPLDPCLIVALGLQISDRQSGPFVIDLRTAVLFDA
jgi:monofunctional biosynthetic peptidoglycan transglycosylase